MRNMAKNETQIREIENEIDVFHKTHPFFLTNFPTSLYYSLNAFEYFCYEDFFHLADLFENKIAMQNNLEALNQLIRWVTEECKIENQLDLEIDENIILKAKTAFVWSNRYYLISNEYKLLSRGEREASIDKKNVTFNLVNKNIESFYSDKADEIEKIIGIKPKQRKIIKKSNLNLKEKLHIADNSLQYESDMEIWKGHQSRVKTLWDECSELQYVWEKAQFDNFSFVSFKKFWIALATLAHIHISAHQIHYNKDRIDILNRNGRTIRNFQISKEMDTSLEIKNYLLINTKDDFIKTISEKSKISEEECKNIFDYLTFDKKIKHNDVIFQPIFQLKNETYCISPNLIISSNPERNLMMLLHKKEDEKYFNEWTNQKEKVMIRTISNKIRCSDRIKTKNNIKFHNNEIDYVIYDKNKAHILICELKWFIEPDSVHEMSIHEQRLKNGCAQIKKIQTAVEENIHDFMNTFFEDDKKEYTISSCLISKNCINVHEMEITVISMKQFLDLIKRCKNDIEKMSNELMNKTYLKKLPENLNDITTYRSKIEYSDYIFEIPSFYGKERDYKSY